MRRGEAVGNVGSSSTESVTESAAHMPIFPKSTDLLQIEFAAHGAERVAQQYLSSQLLTPMPVSGNSGRSLGGSRS
jgi:hypothetical protein